MSSLLRGALTDENGQGDIAYLSMAGLGLAVLGPIAIMTWLDVYSVLRCTPKEIIIKEAVTVISCKYDPQPLGTAIGLACGGFGVALGALAAYMAATRKPQTSSTTTTSVRETVTAAVPAAPGQPLQVAVVDMPPADAPRATARKSTRKAKR